MGQTPAVRAEDGITLASTLIYGTQLTIEPDGGRRRRTLRDNKGQVPAVGLRDRIAETVDWN